MSKVFKEYNHSGHLSSMTDDGHSPINMGVYGSVCMLGIKFFLKNIEKMLLGGGKVKLDI